MERNSSSARSACTCRPLLGRQTRVHQAPLPHTPPLLPYNPPAVARTDMSRGRLPSTSDSACLRRGTREVPPSSSTAATSPAVRLLRSRRVRSGAAAFVQKSPGGDDGGRGGGGEGLAGGTRQQGACWRRTARCKRAPFATLAAAGAASRLPLASQPACYRPAPPASSSNFSRVMVARKSLSCISCKKHSRGSMLSRRPQSGRRWGASEASRGCARLGAAAASTNLPLGR